MRAERLLRLPANDNPGVRTRGRDASCRAGNAGGRFDVKYVIPNGAAEAAMVATGAAGNGTDGRDFAGRDLPPPSTAISGRRRRPVAGWVAAVVVAATAAVFGPTAALAGADAVPAPKYGAYLGAWVNPGSTPFREEEDIGDFEHEISRAQAPPAAFRRLALHLHYYDFAIPEDGQYVPSFPDRAMLQDAVYGRTPVVTWDCGAVLGVTNAAIAAGDWDAVIDATAAAVKAYAKPIMLRWYWEMNLSPDANVAQDCMGTTVYPYPASAAAEFVAAWRHIYRRFQRLGVDNVAWVWNPDGVRRLHPDAGPFFPGSAYVDWIGFDGYDQLGLYDFGKLFSSFYNEFATDFATNFPGQAPRPLLVGETGECTGKSPDGKDLQSKYLRSVQMEIKGEPNPRHYWFPQVKGIDYYDANGGYKCPNGGLAWRLSRAARAQFGRMAYDPFFAPTP
jgi:hypothetical protein